MKNPGFGEVWSISRRRQGKAYLETTAEGGFVLSDEQRDRVCVVLVRARNPNNIGAVARAMYDLGFGQLRLVTEFDRPFEGAKAAVDASEVLGTARVCRSVAEAVEDCTLVVGTTAVGARALEQPLEPVAEAAERMTAELAGEAGRVAILFGSEKTGLSNEELSHCHSLLTIPMQAHAGARHPSMNLGQAAAVCLYELVRGRELPKRSAAESAMAARESERLAGLLREVLDEAGYMRHHPANSGSEDLRRLVLRMGGRATDGPVWMGMLRQVLWRLRGGQVSEEQRDLDAR